jgi:CubicO group peptidase (beta-lactamase class C family)
MSSGYDAKGGTYGPGSQDGSPTPFAASTPSFSPGRNFGYWDDAMNLYGLALSRAAGKNFASLFDEKIARRIGIKRYSWNPVFQDGSLKVSSGSGNKSALNIDAEEMARFCYLYLSEGSWNKQEILSRQWVSDSTHVQVPASLPMSKKSQNYSGPGVYGHNWWVNGTDSKGKRLWPSVPARAFAALGAQTNFCIVIPEWEMVVVRLGTKGTGSAGSVQNEFLKRLGSAIKK